MFFRLLLLTLAPAFAGAHIHIGFHNGTTTQGAMTSRPAGGIVNTGATTWNAVVNNGGVGLSFSNFVLRDAGGADTGARLAGTSGYTFYNSNNWGAHTQDWVMMEGWYGFRATEFLAVTNLPPAYAEGFSVVIYGDSDAANRTMNYTIGGQTRTIQDSGTFAGTFTDGVNFVRFSGLTGTSFTLTGNPGTGAARSAVNGLVILPGRLPEPPAIASFAAAPAYVAAGGSAVLSWSVTGADTLEIAPGVGVVQGASGSLQMTVDATTTFTLTATNADGQRTATARVGAGPPRPNILFFLVDDMGWQDTSVPFQHAADGTPVVTALNQRYRTPAMETLASRGVKFTNAYAMPVCSPSRVCWLTGLNSARHLVTNWTNVTNTDTNQNSVPTHRSPANWRTEGLPPSLPTLPRLLQAAGYRTIHAGKAHFGNSTFARDPRNAGFDINIAGSEIGHPGSYSGDYGQSTNRPVPGLTEYHNTGTHLSEALTLEINKAITRAVADGAPFFAYMAHYAVHSPFQLDPRFSGNYPGLSGQELAYATLLEGMDKSLGDILAQLEQLGVAENTLVVFMSDNGGDAPTPDVNQSNAPLRHKKGSKYEGGSRVPMLAAWARPAAGNPFQSGLPISQGRRVDDIVAIFDLCPTFAAVAGVAPPGGIDGHDLTPYLRGEAGSHRPQELLIHFPHDHRSAYFTNFREGDWKLIHNYPPDSFELYHLASDLSEATDLAAAEPVRVMRMGRKMARALAAAGAQWPRLSSNNSDDPLLMPALTTIDADGDGIPDVLEDPNRNGLVDPGETDPDNADTDGDGTPDGIEIRTGTDPLDPASAFRLIPRHDGGRLTLTWPSAPGALYRVEATIDLPSGSWHTLAQGIPAAGATTSHDLGPIGTDERRFFRVGLE